MTIANWQATQTTELATWKELISASPEGVYGELADAAELNAFLCAHDVTYERAIEVGVGPLGIGWIAAFGHGTPDALYGSDPLPRIEARTGVTEVDEFVERLQHRITYVQGRAEDRPVGDGSFDLVVCENVIDHAESPASVLYECHRLLAPGGTLAFGVNVFSTAGHVKWTRYTRPRHPDAPNTVMHPHSYTERAARHLLTELDWRIVAEERSPLARRLVGHAYRYRLLAHY
jgi:SAM-dependent methyltransferase